MNFFSDPEIKQEPPDVEDSPNPKQVNSPNPKKAKVGRPKATDSPKQKKPKIEVVPLPAIATEKPKRIRKPKIIPDSYEGPFLVPKKSRPVNDDQFEPLKPGQLRRRRKKVAPETAAKISVESSTEKELNETDESSLEKTSNEADNGVKVKEEELESENQSTQNKTKSSPVENESSTYEDIINEVAKGKRRRKKSKEKIETEVNNKEKDENSPNKDNTASQPVSATNTLIEINNSVDWIYPERGQEYVFNLEKHMITQGPNGCVYTCDICTGIYKNKFSLKRHYLRNHINYRYLSKADIINCLINLQQVLETEGESGMVNVKTEPDETHGDTLDSSDGTNCAGGIDSGLTHDGISSDAYNSAIIENVNENGEMVNCYLNNSEKAETAIEDPASAPSNILPAVENGVEKSEYGRSEKSITQSAEKESKDLKTKIIAEKEGQNSELCNEDMKNFEIVDKQIKETGDTNTYLARKPETETTTSSENDKRTNGFVNNDSKLSQTRVKTEQQQGLYRCYTCRQIFDTLQQIKCHTALGHPEEINTKMQYSCDKCHMRFYFKHNLVRHSASHEVKLERKRRSKYIYCSILLQTQSRQAQR